MANYNFKHSNFFSNYQSDKKIGIEELLKKDYADIYESMMDENFELNVDDCDIFNEIKYNHKVVGFSTYNLIDNNNLILTEIYVLPAFRGNKLFNWELTYLFNEGYVVSIHQPSKKIVELLIKYGYAEKINKSLVVSAINFTIDKKNLIFDDNNFLGNFDINFTNLYDLNISANLIFNIKSIKSYQVAYSKVSIYDKGVVEEDIRKNLDKNYFDETVSILTRRDLEIERRIILLKDNLPSENLDLKEIFSSKNMADIFMDYVEKGIVSLNEIKMIKQQLFIDLTRSAIRMQAIPLRLNYLALNYNNNKEIDDNINPCPYCNEELDYSQRYCISCGYDTFNDINTNKENFLFKDVLKEKQSYKYSINNIVEKKEEYGEDYLISLAICYVIDNLNIRNYEEIFDLAANYYGIYYLDLRQIMDDKGYITYDVLESNWFEEAHEFNVSELKNILLKNNIKQSGNKDDLINRIKSNISLKTIKSKVPKITELGFDFKKDSYPVLFHDDYLNNYVYEEFAMIYNNSKKTSINDITIDFLEQHVNKAIKSKNHDQLVDSLSFQSYLHSQNNDIEELLRTELKIFFVNINMLFVDEVYYDYYEALNEDNYKLLKKLMHNYDFEEMVFILNLIHDSFDEKDLNISMDETVEILNRMNREGYTSLNRRIRYNHYPSKSYVENSSSKRKKLKITSLDDFF